MSLACSFSAEQLAGARELFVADASIASIARYLKISPGTVRKYQVLWSSPVGPGQQPSLESDASAAVKTGSTGGVSVNTNEAIDSETPIAPGSNTAKLLNRVESAVRRELASVEERLGASGPAEAERNARVLASLVKSLADLVKLDVMREGASGGAGNEGNTGHHERAPGDLYEIDLPPKDLAALREELAVRLRRLRESRDSDRISG